MKTDLQIGSKIKVTDKASKYYRWRGVVSDILTQRSLFEQDSYDIVGFICSVRPDGNSKNVETELKPDQIACIQKKFIDIEHIRENNIVIGKDNTGNDIVRFGNTGAFEPGDIIQISEKIDGANASIAWNADENRLEIFSRTNLLDGVDGLRGFKQYIEIKFKPDEFKSYPDFVIFGEWCVSHKVKYEKSWYNQWRVYDIWSKKEKNYMPQDFVRDFCSKHGIEYIHALYDGPFISWEHCRSFMNVKSYGGIEQEGIVIKNQSKLSRDDVRFPKYLKIVNDEFKESVRVKEKKEIDPAIVKEMSEAKALMSSIVTEARVNKIILKLIDEDVLPKDLTPKCMGIVMKNVPKMVWDDILKEEREIVIAAGEYASKFCSCLVAEFARKIVIGS